MRDGKWESTIRAYDARGRMTLDVSHSAPITRYVEIEALGRRMRDKDDRDVAYFDLIWHVEPFTTKRYYDARQALDDLRETERSRSQRG